MAKKDNLLKLYLTVTLSTQEFSIVNLKHSVKYKSVGAMFSSQIAKNERLKLFKQVRSRNEGHLI